MFTCLLYLFLTVLQFLTFWLLKKIIFLKIICFPSFLIPLKIYREFEKSVYINMNIFEFEQDQFQTQFIEMPAWSASSDATRKKLNPSLSILLSIFIFYRKSTFLSSFLLYKNESEIIKREFTVDGRFCTHFKTGTEIEHDNKLL